MANGEFEDGEHLNRINDILFSNLTIIYGECHQLIIKLATAKDCKDSAQFQKIGKYDHGLRSALLK